MELKRFRVTLQSPDSLRPDEAEYPPGLKPCQRGNRDQVRNHSRLADQPSLCKCQNTERRRPSLQNRSQCLSPAAQGQADVTKMKEI
mmetsp:Transcript_43571/g.115054  ORF Transcript_43571/g.115054 Transcript_43571/m.115054 type:complete len:87 (-) Transcript_43571:1574-1834(-)